jgi:exonuclease VII large subunit
MARSVRSNFKGAGDGTGGGDDELLKQAREAVRANHETMRQNLLHLQSLEIKHLESERKWINEQKARDVSVFDRREIASINQRYDRQQQRLEQKQNGFWGKMHRLVGGHKSQQRQVARLNAERDRVVTERTAQQVRSEGQRQRSLTERDVRVEKDIQQAREKHSEAREKQRQSQEQGFDHAVKHELNRLRHVPKQRM